MKRRPHPDDRTDQEWAEDTLIYMGLLKPTDRRRPECMCDTHGRRDTCPKCWDTSACRLCRRCDNPRCGSV